MTDFDLKKWLIENRSGMYSKVAEADNYDETSDTTDQVTNRGDLEEINPAALGADQAAADAEMQKKDDENGDWVDNASMDTVAEDIEEQIGVAYVSKVRSSDPKVREKEFWKKTY